MVLGHRGTQGTRTEMFVRDSLFECLVTMGARWVLVATIANPAAVDIGTKLNKNPFVSHDIIHG